MLLGSVDDTLRKYLTKYTNEIQSSLTQSSPITKKGATYAEQRLTDTDANTNTHRNHNVLLVKERLITRRRIDNCQLFVRQVTTRSFIHKQPTPVRPTVSQPATIVTTAIKKPPLTSLLQRQNPRQKPQTRNSSPSVHLREIFRERDRRMVEE